MGEGTEQEGKHIRLSEYLTKGRLLLVEGTLSTSLWKDKEDNPQIQISNLGRMLKFIKHRQA